MEKRWIEFLGSMSGPRYKLALERDDDSEVYILTEFKDEDMQWKEMGKIVLPRRLARDLFVLFDEFREIELELIRLKEK